MLTVKTPEEVFAIIKDEFSFCAAKELAPLAEALDRVLYEDIIANVYVPDFDRSAVDGYAVRAADTFGCSVAIPSILPLHGEVLMGEPATALPQDSCMYVPTGGAIPKGADAVVMIEYSEDYGDASIGINKAVAPGNNIVFRGDDVKPGAKVLPKGKKLEAQDLGSLAALGITQIPVCTPLRVGVFSTGDELVAPDQAPGLGQVRDINSTLVTAAISKAGGQVTCYGVIKDDPPLLKATVEQAIADNDLLILSGGSSVGTKDATCGIIEQLGEVLFHGIAIKPGKPTILGKINGKPVVGLPGHPAAAFFICHLFVLPLLYQLQGRQVIRYPITARLSSAAPANHGRSQYTIVSLEEQNGIIYAHPQQAKSAQITNLSSTDGYICIPRDCEGLPAGATVQVTLYAMA